MNKYRYRHRYLQYEHSKIGKSEYRQIYVSVQHYYFGQGTTRLIKKIQVDAEVQQISSLISDSQVTAKEVGKAGARLFVISIMVVSKKTP